MGGWAWKCGLVLLVMHIGAVVLGGERDWVGGRADERAWWDECDYVGEAWDMQVKRGICIFR